MLETVTGRLALLVGVLLVAAVTAVLLRRRDGRDRAVTGGEVLAESDLAGSELGERATLLQLSSAFCAPCRQTRAVLGRLAAATPGVTHVELDVADHLDLVRRLDIRRTPTVLVLDAAGRVVRRASGALTPAQAAHALAATAGAVAISAGEN